MTMTLVVAVAACQRCTAAVKAGNCSLFPPTKPCSDNVLCTSAAVPSEPPLILITTSSSNSVWPNNEVRATAALDSSLNFGDTTATESGPLTAIDRSGRKLKAALRRTVGDANMPRNGGNVSFPVRREPDLAPRAREEYHPHAVIRP